MKLAPGVMVTDKVRLEKPLGEGGMGAVWTAQHLSLEMRVAAKFIHAELVASNPSLVRRFEREAKIAAQIRSPHVVQVFDNGVTSDGTPYIVMEMLHGNSLAEWLDLEGRLGLREVGRIVSQVASALHKAHRIGIVHRDIKPDNIFLVEDEDDVFIKVLDFGIAKAEATPRDKRMTAVGAVIGTPLYMSPEQAQSSKDVDAGADLWALAVVAYEAISGRVPFNGDSIPEIVIAIMRGKFTPISRWLEDGGPDGLDRFFVKAFHRDPRQRFASGREMAETLQRLVGESPGSAEVFSPPLETSGRSDSQSSAETRVPAAKATQASPPPREKTRAPAPEKKRAWAPTAPAEKNEGDAAVERRSDPQRRERDDWVQPAMPSAAIELDAPRRAVRAERAPRPVAPAQGSATQAYGRVLPAVGLVVAALLVVPFLEPLGRDALAEKLGAAAAAIYGAAALASLLAGAKLWDHGNASSSTLKLAGAGLLVLGVALGATAAGIGAPGIGFESFEVAVVTAGSLGASSVALGLGAFGLLQMREAFGGNERDVGYGVLLLIMSLAGLGAAYRMARPVVTPWLGAVPTRANAAVAMHVRRTSTRPSVRSHQVAGGTPVAAA